MHEYPSIPGRFCPLKTNRAWLGSSARHMGSGLEEAVAYGDSISDALLLAAVGYRLSVNGDLHLRDLCDIEIRGNDLYDAYRAARRYIDRPDGRDRQRDFCRQ